MVILQLLLTLFNGLLLALLSYLLLLTLAAVFARKSTTLASNPQTHFLILVPAHNEQQLLPRLLRSLSALDYPTTQFEVHVVADNCTDDTGRLARQMNAVVHERFNANERGKGYALQWLLSRIWDADVKHDAVAIIDADSHVTANFLRVMDTRLRQGARALQAYYAVDDPQRAASVAIRYAAFAVLHYLRPLGRMVLGGSAGLKGNGMVFTADLMRQHSWSAALTEDIEFHMDLLFAGEQVQFAPDAIVWADMPGSLSQTQTQHTRWEQGRMQMARRYVPRLFDASWRAARRGQWRRAYLLFDAALEHLLPPLAVFVALIFLAFVLSVAIWAGGRVLLPDLSLTFFPINLIISLILVTGLSIYLLVGLKLAQAPRSVYLSLLTAPQYIFWKCRHYLHTLQSKEHGIWIRTTRDRS
jgi:cellulose synthase/poly-beta-1,6-N-acetylglucosamine synthase-like glycosyltransferase